MAKQNTRQKPRKPKAEIRRQSAPLQTEVLKCEARIAKLEDMRKKLDGRLADPDLYTPANTRQLAALQEKNVELKQAIARAETLWLASVEKLENAKKA